MSGLRNRLFAFARHEADSHLRIVLMIRALLGFEAMLYSAVTPLLPHYAHEFSASKPAIGLLAASYPAGMLPGSLLGAWLATRVGVRRTTVIGLLIFVVSITAFGFASSIIALDVLRFVQGAACGCVWGGGLAWVIAIAPRERRGEVLGSVIGAAILGTLLGPALGTLAVTVGTEVVFASLGVVSLGLVLWTLQHPEPPPAEATTQTPARELVRNRKVLLGFWMILLEALTLGAAQTLIPLRLSRFGASEVAIGATFLLMSLISAFVATPIGRLVDRRGPRLPLCFGLVTTAIMLAALPLAQSAFGLAALTVLALGGPLTAYTIPSMSVITDTSERMGVAAAFATMQLNLAWALGETFGAPAAATISQATSDTVALLLLSLLMILTLPAVLRARLTPGQDPPAKPASEGRSEHGAALDSASIVG
jgi:predicted MFS family arabinose efflux permease